MSERRFTQLRLSVQLSSIAALIGVVVLGACASKPAAPAPPAPASPAAAQPAGKPTAPVAVKLSSSAPSGQVVVTMEVTATAEAPRAVARFVVPDGVTVVDGTTEVELGKLAAGASRTHTITLQVPGEGSYSLAAGVDVHMSPGAKLVKSAVLKLGAPAPATTEGARVIRRPGEETGIRLAPGKKKP